MAHIAYLLLGVLLLITLGVYYFMHEVVVVWFALALNFLKGFTFKAILGTLAYFLKRWFLIEVPKKLVLIMFKLGMPRRWRAWVRAFAKDLRERIAVVQVRVKRRYSWLFGNKVAFLLAAVASTTLFVVGVVYFGFYVFWFFGAERFLGPILRFGWLWFQNQLFKLGMFAYVKRVSSFIARFLPAHFRLRMKSSWFRFKRKFVRSRRDVTRKVETSIERRRRHRQLRLLQRNARLEKAKHLHVSGEKVKNKSVLKPGE